jgi:hypothetical protein
VRFEPSRGMSEERTVLSWVPQMVNEQRVRLSGAGEGVGPGVAARMIGWSGPTEFPGAFLVSSPSGAALFCVTALCVGERQHGAGEQGGEMVSP